MPKPFSRFKKTVIIASAAALAFVGAGVAYAYWTSTGNGSGSAKTDTALNQFKIVTDTEPSGVLAPGSSGQTIAFTVSNEGAGTLLLNSVTATLADVNGVPWVPTGSCLIADYSVTISTPPTYGELAPGAAVNNGRATVTMVNTPGVSQDDCKGQTVPVYFSAS